MRLFFIYCFHESGIKMVSSAKSCLRFILMNEKKMENNKEDDPKTL